MTTTGRNRRGRRGVRAGGNDERQRGTTTWERWNANATASRGEEEEMPLLTTGTSSFPNGGAYVWR
jgi:hypothetical protein